jgi:hypothetical protein
LVQVQNAIKLSSLISVLPRGTETLGLTFISQFKQTIISSQAPPHFTSLNSHLGIEQSRRDDLESLAYILIYFLRGSLPWYNTKASTHNQHNRIRQMKVNSIPNLLAGLPHEFSVFLDYTCALGFEGKPSYAYMRSLFCDLCIREGHEDDVVFDWCLPMMSLDDETPSNHKRINMKTLSREHDAAVGYSDRVYVHLFSLQYIYV